MTLRIRNTTASEVFPVPTGTAIRQERAAACLPYSGEVWRRACSWRVYTSCVGATYEQQVEAGSITRTTRRPNGGMNAQNQISLHRVAHLEASPGCRSGGEASCCS